MSVVTGDLVFDAKKVLVDFKGELWNARRGAGEVFGMVLMAVERANGRRSANAMVESTLVSIQVVVALVVDT